MFSSIMLLLLNGLLISILIVTIYYTYKYFISYINYKSELSIMRDKGRVVDFEKDIVKSQDKPIIRV